MPNRILKDSICTSEEIDGLNAFQETFFYRLIVNCDDFGRMDARPKILASRLFPLREIRASQIGDALNALVAAKLIILYEVDGKPYIQMRTWDKHQQVRAKKSKYPAPADGIAVDDVACNQLISIEGICPRNPIQSNTNPNPNPIQDERFEKFWEAYPKHTAKDSARKAFKKINPDDELMEKMLTAIKKQKESRQWQENGGQFIPMSSTWLNGKRWEDEVQAGSTTRTVNAPQYSQRDYSDEQAEAMRRMLGAAGM